MIHNLVIAAPFGNWLRWPSTTPTLGTFTKRRRGNPFWRCLLTLRPTGVGGWVNRLGLPNPGADAGLAGVDLRGKIVSVRGGFERWDWSELVSSFVGLPVESVELNVSCPNVGTGYSAVDAAELGLAYKIPVSVKLPPVGYLRTACDMYSGGVRSFCCCNTLPVAAGGLSGPRLKPYGVAAVRALRERWGGGVSLTGCGGVYSVKDALDYLEAGADRVAVASALLNPFAWYRVPLMCYAVEEAKGGR